MINNLMFHHMLYLKVYVIKQNPCIYYFTLHSSLLFLSSEPSTDTNAAQLFLRVTRLECDLLLSHMRECPAVCLPQNYLVLQQLNIHNFWCQLLLEGHNLQNRYIDITTILGKSFNRPNYTSIICNTFRWVKPTVVCQSFVQTIQQTYGPSLIQGNYSYIDLDRSTKGCVTTWRQNKKQAVNTTLQ
jgi:hypothetical protein